MSVREWRRHGGSAATLATFAIPRAPSTRRGALLDPSAVLNPGKVI